MNALPLFASGLLASAALAQPCTPHWTTDFTMGGPNGEVSCMLPFNAGSGEMLYIGGRFQHAADVPADGLAMWDGERFRAVPGWNGGYVRNLAVLPGAGGPSLLAATGVIWQMQGEQWTRLQGPNQDEIFRVVGVHDDGAGPQVYAAGWVSSAWPSPPIRIARWTGSEWSPLPGDFTIPSGSGEIDCITSIDLGSGPSLYVGGRFSEINGAPITGIARWDGATWRPIGGGVSSGSVNGVPRVNRIVRADLGQGPRLYASGQFDYADSNFVRGFAQYDGQAWSAVGDLLNGHIGDLLPIHTPGGPRLMAVGEFVITPGTYHVAATWDGQSWTPFGEGDHLFYTHLRRLHAGAWFGTEPRLFAAGKFAQVGGVSADNVAMTSGAEWSSLRPVRGLSGWGSAIEVFDDGRGPALYAAGAFAHAAGQSINSVARWDGRQWSKIPGMEGTAVSHLAVLDDGRGRALYMAGAGGMPVVMRWDGVSLSGIAAPDTITEMSVADDGSGPTIFIGGYFEGRIRKLERGQWVPLGDGIPWGSVWAIASVRENGVPALFVGGSFTSAGGVAVENLARWDGSQWSHPGLQSHGNVYTMTVAPGTVTDALYIAGTLWRATSGPSSSVARWDGTDWTWVGGTLGPFMYTLRFFDDGNGPTLFAGGAFDQWSSPMAFNIARLAQNDWEAVSGGIGEFMGDESVNALAAFTDSSGPSLIAAGSFGLAGNLSAGNIARWRACPPCYANCDGSIVAPTLNVADFTCFLNRYASGDEWANCDGSTAAPVLNVLDFTCYMGRFAAGCP